VSQTDSHRWTWTLGLLTAASACLLPVSSEAADDCADNLEVTTPASDAALDQCVVAATARAAVISTTIEWTKARGGTTRRASTDVPAADSPIASERDQLLATPGPPIYLIAPSQSPPGTSV